MLGYTETSRKLNGLISRLVGMSGCLKGVDGKLNIHRLFHTYVKDANLVSIAIIVKILLVFIVLLINIIAW